jgi:hypothetical protein
VSQEEGCVPMTRKIRRRMNLKESSSSEEAAQLKLPNEILALGDRLVAEFGLDERGSTAARWMAHHLAEVIEQARSSVGAKQQQANAKAVALILKLWSKREFLPGDAHPLKRWDKALGVLHLLSEEASPFSRASHRKSDRLLSETFDGLRKTVANGLLLTYIYPLEPIHDEVATPFLAEEERRILVAMNAWVTQFKKARRSRLPHIVIVSEQANAVEEGESSPLTEDEALRRTAVSEIDELQKTLAALKEMISGASSA